MPNQKPNLVKVKCFYCGKFYFRTPQRVNESKKYSWRSFCSVECQSLGRSNGEKRTCSNVDCNNVFYRTLSDIKKTKLSFCSSSCAAKTLNSMRILKPKKKCKLCNNYLKYGKKYCSSACQKIDLKTTNIEVIESIKMFYDKKGRIPLKAEMGNYKSARLRFGTWNNAIIAAGFVPNPVMFAKKYIAIDGHKCDSLAERIIDDWLFRRKINHERSVPYPSFEKYTADFVVGNKWVEYFGLSGSLKRYDYLKNRKIRIAKKLKLDLIKLYPKDLFPKGNLDERLKMLLS